jgi:phenylpropionate dioxygenase-like ring-hydroxylating dioxygenase large terminal subunit
MDLSDFRPSGDLSRAETLPARWYLEPGLFQLEQERIFGRCWHLVCLSSELGEPGDYVTDEVAGEPIVVARGDDGTLRAFSNVCRHRAGPVSVGRGNRRSLQCSYHGWTYGLDGRLLRAPEMEGVESFEASRVALPEFRVETWGPFVFVNLDARSAPLAETLGEIRSKVEARNLTFGNVRRIERRTYDIRCNWKVYVDNFLEGYHVPIVHPALFRELDYDRYRVETSRYYSSQDAPLRGASTGGQDEGRVYGGDDQGPLYYWVFPNLMLNFYPGNMQVNVVIPIDHRNTQTLFDWYATEGRTVDQKLRSSIELSEQIQREDMAVCESVQKGLSSRSYDRGRFSVKRENGVHHFQLLVHEFLTR